MAVVIFGTSEFSEYLYYTIKTEGVLDVIAFTLSKSYMNKREFCGLPVLEFEDLANQIFEPFELLISVGYQKMNEGRENIYNQCKERGFKVGSYISTRAICDTEIVGEGCIIMPTAYIQSVTKLGICNVFNGATIIGHTSIIGNFNWFSGNVTIGGNVVVGSNCFIGMNSLIKNNIKVASKTLLGAYSYLNDDTIEGRFYTGNPALNPRKLKSILVCDFI